MKKLMILAILGVFLVAGCDSDDADDYNEKTNTTSGETTTTKINIDEAIVIAKSEVDGFVVEADSDYDNGSVRYEIELVRDGNVYEFNIDGEGRILRSNNYPREGVTKTEHMIGIEAAQKIVVDKLGGGVMTSWDIENQEPNVYELEFEFNHQDYDAKIHANTGEILYLELDD